MERITANKNYVVPEYKPKFHLIDVKVETYRCGNSKNVAVSIRISTHNMASMGK